ncbi:MAG: hypothetical protein J0M33_18350 [Anaerolineae bacterium]|nr:hypothetical protein [Anaerolineae bacterium]
MSESVIAIPRSSTHAQRIAWVVLIMAFAIFCALCIGLWIGAQFFFFESSVPLLSRVIVARGAISVATGAVSAGKELTSGDQVEMVSGSQASLFFRDSQDGNRLVASITLNNDTSVQFWTATVPRFGWSNGGYYVELRGLRGDADIFVPQNLPRAIRMIVTSRQGDLVEISSSGLYALRLTDSRLEVVNRGGNQITLTPFNAIEGRSIPIDDRAVIDSSRPDLVALESASTNMLRNSTFESVFQGLATDWACTNSTDNLPRGSYAAEIQDGRSVMHLARAEDATTNGQTACSQFFGNGVDITSFTNLSFRVAFNLQYQSLNACGTEGSECPLMLRVDYLDAGGEMQQWYLGFYFRLEPNRNDPLRCLGCPLEHVRVNEKTWYTYDSGNWLALFPERLPQRPVAIQSVTFYASGHQYDVYVGEVSLLAS